ncbi:hypothetical protein ACFCXT_15255 [Streptomyces vinaceus]|uniref:hypothetical protein n=1 Tax=Streptomyces vinaceus TaxID=1960 RepID=UPI0035D9DC7B
MTEANWFEAASGPALEQGDVLLGCTVLRPIAAEGIDSAVSEESIEEGSSELEYEASMTDIVILSQTCDLENGKISEVLAAKVISYDALVRQERARNNDMIASSEFRRLCAQGNMPGYALIRPHVTPLEIPWSLISFANLYLLPKVYLESHAEKQGLRLRLKAPYREHVAQSFARYFMRVALPVTANDFSGYKPQAQGA